MSSSVVKGALVGLAWFVAYTVAVKVAVKPLAAKYNVPVLKDL